MTTKTALIIEHSFVPYIQDPDSNASDVTVKITSDRINLLNGFGSAIRLTRGDLADVVRLCIEIDGASSDVFDTFLAQEQQG